MALQSRRGPAHRHDQPAALARAPSRPLSDRRCRQRFGGRACQRACHPPSVDWGRTSTRRRVAVLHGPPLVGPRPGMHRCTRPGALWASRSQGPCRGPTRGGGINWGMPVVVGAPFTRPRSASLSSPLSAESGHARTPDHAGGWGGSHRPPQPPPPPPSPSSPPLITLRSPQECLVVRCALPRVGRGQCPSSFRRCSTCCALLFRRRSMCSTPSRLPQRS